MYLCKNSKFMAKDWKERLGVVYSTNPDFQFDKNNESQGETLIPAKQVLKVTIDRKQRKGKSVTLIQGFIGKEEDIKDLAKILKTKCGVGGSAKDGEIVIQGELTQKVKDILRSLDYKVK
jgi:translation initiation factor 1